MFSLYSVIIFSVISRIGGKRKRFYIDERRSKIVRKRVFDCYLSPVQRSSVVKSVFGCRLSGSQKRMLKYRLVCKKTFCGFSMGRNQYWAGRAYDLCVYYMTGTPEGSTESGFMEKPGIETATPGLQGIALIHYTTGASQGV